MGATNASAIRCIWEGVPFDKNAKHHGPAPTLAWPRIFCKESYQNGKSGFLENAQRPCKVQDIGTTLCFLSSHHNFTSFVRQSDMTIVRFCKYHQLRKLGRTTFRESSLSVVSSLKTEARESELDHVSTGKMKCQGDQLLDFYLIVSDKHISFKSFMNICCLLALLMPTWTPEFMDKNLGATHPSLSKTGTCTPIRTRRIKTSCKSNEMLKMLGKKKKKKTQSYLVLAKQTCRM